MTKEQPLYLRLFFEPHFSDLVRIVGYDGLAEEQRDKALPLLEKYGHQKMDEAQRLLLDIDKDAKRYTLKPEVRKLCTQLLGIPPERAAEFDCPPAGALPLSGPATPSPNGPTDPVPKKRIRKKKGEAHAP